MTAQPSSCELPSGAVPISPDVSTGSRVMRFQSGFRWQGVPVSEYKDSATHHCGVARTTLIGAGGEATAFHVRYFEIAPGGFSSLEHHVHEHVVFVLRGRGQVRLGDRVHDLGHGDVVYVAPREVHQLRNSSDSEPFGFLCMVDARRDNPVTVSPGTVPDGR